MITLPRLAFVLDIETTDTRPTARVLTIGAAVVDTTARKIVTNFIVRLDLHTQAFRSQSDATMDFWRAQPDDVRDNAFRSGPRLHPADGLNELSRFIRDQSQTDKTVWGYGASFDLVVLEDLYRDFGVEVPWTYRQHRDLRTLYELAGIRIDDEDRRGLIPHIAHHDAIAESRAMLRALEIVLGPEPEPAEAGDDAGAEKTEAAR